MALVRQLNAVSKCIFTVGSSKSLARSNPTVNLNVLSRNFASDQSIFVRKEIKLIFTKANGEKLEIKGKEGEMMANVAAKNGLIHSDKPCFGMAICSHCHFTFTKKDYDRLPKPDDLEFVAMDEHVHGVTETSRMGCQIDLTADLDGIEVHIPDNPYVK